MTDAGPEPTGWELQRGISEIKQTLATFATAFVSSQVWALTVDRVTKAETAIESERTARVAAIEAVETQAANDLDRVRAELMGENARLQTQLDQEKTKKNQLWLAFAGAVAAGIVTILVLVFSKGLGLQ